MSSKTKLLFIHQKYCYMYFFYFNLTYIYNNESLFVSIISRPGQMSKDWVRQLARCLPVSGAVCGTSYEIVIVLLRNGVLLRFYLILLYWSVCIWVIFCFTSVITIPFCLFIDKTHSIQVKKRQCIIVSDKESLCRYTSKKILIKKYRAVL